MGVQTGGMLETWQAMQLGRHAKYIQHLHALQISVTCMCHAYATYVWMHGIQETLQACMGYEQGQAR